MCKWEHDSVVGKNRQIPGASKVWITSNTVKRSKNAGDDGGAQLGVHGFISARYADSTLRTSLYHLASSVSHDATPSVALSQHHCAISSWPCKMGRKSVQNGRKLWPTSQEVSKGMKNLVVILWTVLSGNNVRSEDCSVKWRSTMLWRSSHSRRESK